MRITEMKSLIIGNLTATLPIVQGGMGVGVSLAGLASSVANQGGVGVIAAAGIGMFEPDSYTNYVEANIRALRKEIRKAREMTKGILGVNIMVALSDFAELAKAAIDEGIDIIFSGAGLPLKLPEISQGSDTKLVPIVSSAKAASIIAKRWMDKYNYLPDAVVVEGPKAGGHLGFKHDQLEEPQFSIEKLVTEVVAALKPFVEKFNKPIPVIAGGGIYTGEDIYNMMQLGADGVQMATRFVTTKECDASVNFKQAYIDAKPEDIAIIKSPVGLPGRAVRNDFIAEVEAGNRIPFKCPYHCIVTCDYLNSPFCIALALINAQKGIMKNGFAFAGENAYRATEIIPMQQLVDTIKEEYREAVESHVTA
ncbi:MAG: nitronate monooxygenase [Hyphomonadaceae bacterium]|nr:nitronate monooxygenase [Clostridia bacterium]